MVPPTRPLAQISPVTHRAVTRYYVNCNTFKDRALCKDGQGCAERTRCSSRAMQRRHFRACGYVLYSASRQEVLTQAVEGRNTCASRKHALYLYKRYTCVSLYTAKSTLCIAAFAITELLSYDVLEPIFKQ